MSDKPLIPSAIFERIKKFLGAGATGQIVLDVHAGRIRKAVIADHFKAEDDPVVPIDVQRVPPLKTR